MKREIPVAVIRRMPKYHRELLILDQAGEDFVSTPKLAAATGVHDSQIRKDIALTGLRGVPKRGHKIKDLISAIETFLNWNDVSSAFLIGVGNIGKALLNYTNYEQYGLKIIAAFDTNPDVIGQKINGIQVFDVSKLENLVQRLKVPVGVITVPASAAQETAEALVRSGIKGIWNFAPVTLDIPDYIILENVNLYHGLGVLSKRLKEKLNP